MTVIKIPLSWLNDFVEVSDLDPIELAERLTLAGLEVEHIRWMGLNPSERYHLPVESMDEGDGLGWERDKIFVGEIVRTERHPNADRLLLATIEYGGDKPMTIITGAPSEVDVDADEGDPDLAEREKNLSLLLSLIHISEPTRPY